MDEVNVPMKLGYTHLIYAIWNNCPVVVRALIELGADVNQKDRYEWTPLYMVIRVRNHEIVKMLLEAGADPNYECPLRFAENANLTQIRDLLLEYGARPLKTKKKN